MLPSPFLGWDSHFHRFTLYSLNSFRISQHICWIDLGGHPILAHFWELNCRVHSFRAEAFYINTDLDSARREGLESTCLQLELETWRMMQVWTVWK